MFDNDKSKTKDAEPVNLAVRFAESQKFKDLFSYGMELVEETAAFLDSEGREAAKLLSKPASAVYGSESMRLTTRLMQIASWLLLQRAVVEGEMTMEQALKEKNNVKLSHLHSYRKGAGWDELPEAFISLVDRSLSLQKRIHRLDQEIYSNEPVEEKPTENPVASQRALLETAFDPRFSR